MSPARSPRPNAIVLNTSGCATATAAFAATTRSVHSAVAVVGAKHVVSLQAWYRSWAGTLSSPGATVFATLSRTPIAKVRSKTASGWSTPTSFSIDRRREDDLRHRDAGRRVDRQHGGNQIRIARLVGLDVVAVGQRDLQRDARIRSCADAVGFDDGRDVGLDAAQLRRRDACQAEPCRRE